MIAYLFCLVIAAMSQRDDYGDTFHVARSSASDMFLGKSGDRLLAESVEHINDFTVCKWNVAKSVCSADTERILNSVNLTSIGTQLILDATRMLACSSYGQNSPDCAVDEFCEEDANGTCRASSGPNPLRFIYAAIQPSIQQCGWLGEFFNAFACRAHSLTECPGMGCKVIRDIFRNKSGFCEEQPVCGDDAVSYMYRLCGGVPGWDLGKMVLCLQLRDVGQQLNCTRAVCPQMALRLEYSLIDPCPALTSRTDCLINDKCTPNGKGGCEKDPFKVLQQLSPPSCAITEGITWSFMCSSARSPDRCAGFGRECVWAVSESCSSSGHLHEVGSCRGAPEMLGLYIRPSSKRKNKFSNESIHPTIDLLSRVIASAHVCPSLAKQQCHPPDGSSSKYGGNNSSYGRSTSSGTDDIPMQVVVPTTAGAIILIIVFAMMWRCYRKNKQQSQRKQEAVAAAQVVEHSKSHEGMSSNKQQAQRAQEALAAAQVRGHSEPHEGTSSSSGGLGNSSKDFATDNPAAFLNRGISEHWYINESSMDLESAAIGKGGFGEVRRGTLFGNTEVAVKLPYKQGGTVIANPALINEVRLLRRLRHPNIVLFHGVSIIGSGELLSLGIVLEWVSGGDLQRFVKARHESGHFYEDCKAVFAGALIKEVKLLMDVARGLGYLHSQITPILHRDVKPGNILIESHEPPLAKLADFGLSSLADGRQKGRAGSTMYMAPEISNNLDYDLPADVYSFGRVVLFINTGVPDLPESQGQ
eukprot:TRINITY_DN5114_c0_g1_i1.p1 TRINITY_DN5114_c0_g1~~TRINITY_DN5114_c0_g1_i1.p1  ORF type:complete len:755 (-),score=112.74 TRINITY_DN5114_c0_g1_i1:216-2480(-)